MNLQENIRRILREENTLPNLIRRRFSEEELYKLVSNVERTFETHRISQQHREDVIDAEVDDFIMNSVYYGEFEDFDDEIYQEIYNLYREPLVNYIKSKLDVNLQESIRKVLREVRVPRSERVELYKDENIIVVVPLTHRALQKYAHECQWCINDDLGEWEDYHKGRHVVIIQRNPKKPKIGITGNPTASEIFLLAKWDNNQSSFEDVCQMLDYEFRNDRTMSDYYVTISNDINNFATNIVYYSPETGIYDQEDNFLWNFNIEINDIPNVKPKVIEIMDDYLQENEEMSLQESIRKILREELESKWNTENKYDYQHGFCHYFAYNIIGRLKKLYPNKNIRYYLILADEVYDYDEGEVEQSYLIHAYIKIDDLYLDSNGFATEDEIEKRTQDWYNRQLNDLPEDYRIDIWHDEYNRIPRKFINSQFCDTGIIKKDIETFLSHPEVRELLKIID